MKIELNNFNREGDQILLDRAFYDGRLRVQVYTAIDQDPQFDYLGEFTDKMNYSPETGIYDRQTGLMYDGSHWKDSRGRFAEEPALESYGYRSECRFIEIGTCQFTKKDQHWLKYAFQNAKRLDKLGNNWDYVTIHASIELDDEPLGSSCCGGYESDMTEGEYLSLAREMLTEAFRDAKRSKYASSIAETQDVSA